MPTFTKPITSQGSIFTHVVMRISKYLVYLLGGTFRDTIFLLLVRISFCQFLNQAYIRNLGLRKLNHTPLRVMAAQMTAEMPVSSNALVNNANYCLKISIHNHGLLYKSESLTESEPPTFL
ncbi:hypothetical protein TNCV_1708871 [Trichonephila clavipes]|nr:hypothetical protein TNCV_1708871 [Trichonephila clavipes]